MASEDKSIRVLLVDDEEDSYILIKGRMGTSRRGTYHLDWVSKYADALERIARAEHDVYLIDYRLGTRDGLELIQEALQNGCDAPLILLTGFDDPKVDMEAMRVGAADFLIKDSFDADLMDRSIRYSMRQASVMRALRASETKFRSIAETATDAIISFNSAGRIVYSNKSAQEMFEYPETEMLGKGVASLSPERYRDSLASDDAWWMTADPANFGRHTREAQGLRKDGTEFPLELSLAKWASEGQSFYTAVLRDISERKRLENVVIHSGKLAAMGQVAAVLAHEIKTPLTAISLHTGLLFQKVGKNFPDLTTHLEVIRRHVERCSNVARRMLDFSRKNEAPMEKFDLNDAAISAMDLVGAKALSKAVAIGRTPFPQPLKVRGHRDHIEQVIVNLLNNALDAVPRNGGVEISTGWEEQGGQRFAVLQVSDTGVGISPEVELKMFDPFFSTKEKGEGSGLGLWLVREMISQHKGQLRWKSAVGEGTTFGIVLPLAPDEKSPVPAQDPGLLEKQISSVS